MTPAEAAALLTHIAANDNREVTEAASKAWSVALPDVDVKDAIAVLPTYYREATRDGRNWIYPGDILDLVRDLHVQQRRALLAPIRAKWMDCDDYDERPKLFAEIQRLSKEYDETHTIPAGPRNEAKSPATRAAETYKALANQPASGGW